MAPMMHDPDHDSIETGISEEDKQQQQQQAVQFVNISPFLHGTPSEKNLVVQAWRTACITQGFIAVQGHGVPLSLQHEMLDAMASFFALPLSEKEKVDIHRSELKPGMRQGYERVGTQKLESLDPNATADMKEGFSFNGKGIQPDDAWPERPVEFRSVCERYYEAVSQLAIVLFRITALSLDLPETYFDGLATDPGGLSNCRGHHYPPGSGNEGERGIGAHTDFGTLTILLQDGIGGLEVMHRPTGAWHRFEPVEGAFVVNIGDLLQRWTNNRYKSTMHRVISNTAGRDRYSVAFFCGMVRATIIECLSTCLEADEKPLYPPISVEEHYRKRYDQSYGTSKVEKVAA